MAELLAEHRSRERLEDSLKRIDVLTLGSGALAGTNLPIDRAWVKKQLGFSRISQNSLDAVGDREFVVELVQIIATLGVELSRIAEDLLIGQIEEIGIYELPEELCTGSSMMPQKKNPDFLELARGVSGSLVGNATALLVLLKGVPGSYNRDLQWDKKPLFESVELIEEVLGLFEILFSKLRVNQFQAMVSLKNDQLCSTDLAEAMVLKGVPFREAHERVGRLVAHCESEGMSLREASPSVQKLFLGERIPQLGRWLDVEQSVKQKKSFGSTGPGQVKLQIRQWERKIRASL